jgi:hypothetical protein
VTATSKRAFSTLLIAALLAFTASLFTATAANAGGSAPHQGASGSVGVLGEHFVKYCVKHFKPNSNVTVTNETTGATVTIHTDSQGAGCAEVPIKRECKANTEQIVATGTGADGNPATVRSTITVPATPSLCSSNQGGTLPFTGSNIIIPGAIIGLVLIIAGTAMTVVRRRRQDGVPV